MNVIIEEAQPKSQSLIPPFISNAFAALNEVSLTALVVTRGCRKLAEGVDEVATLTLAAQKRRLLAEANKLPQVIEIPASA